MRDACRQEAYREVQDWLTTNHTNTIATGHVWRAVNMALDAYEDEMSRTAEAARGYAITLGSVPMLVVNTRRQARQQLKIMRRLIGDGDWKIRRTQVAVLL